VIVACLLSVVSVVVGALIGLMPRGDRGFLGPIRTFAFAAALTVCFATFLPEAFESLGIFATLPFALGLALPILLEKALTLAARKQKSVNTRLELAYIGLVIHQFADGLSLGSFATGVHEGHEHLEVNLSIAAHTIPIVALFVMSFVALRGRSSAMFRAAGLALAVILGVFASSYAGITFDPRHAAIVSAAACGLLLHVVLHDAHSALPKSMKERSTDFIAGALGVAILFLGTHSHGVEHAQSAHAVDLLRETATQAAPALLIGLLLLAIARRWPAHRFARGISLASLEVALWALIGFSIGFTLAYLVAVTVGIAVATVFFPSWFPEPRSDPRRPSFVHSFIEEFDRKAATYAIGLACAAIIILIRLAEPPSGMGLALGCIALTVVATVSPLGGAGVAEVMTSLQLSPAMALSGLVFGVLVHGLRGTERSPWRWAIALGGAGVAALCASFFVHALETSLSVPRAVSALSAIALAALFVARAFWLGIRGLFCGLGDNIDATDAHHADCDHHHSVLEEIHITDSASR
jgi:hypothetical protein